MNNTPDKAPINRQSAIHLSQGLDQVDSVEEALYIFGQRIASPEFAKQARQIIEAGTNLKYVITVKKGNQPGFIVALNYNMEAPKQSLGTFLRLV
jgi:hypothetical protein